MLAAAGGTISGSTAPDGGMNDFSARQATHAYQRRFNATWRRAGDADASVFPYSA